MGSKSKIAKIIIEHIPHAENFYDLFAGGGAITHAAILSGFWCNFYANDIQDSMKLFSDAVAGKYRNEKRWISRSQFFAEMDADPYVRWIWSFGNDGKTYLFGKDVEPVKKAAHEYLMANGYNGTIKSRIDLIKSFKNEAKVSGRFELEQIERLQRLQQLQQLQQLERLQQLEISKLDYRDVPIKPNSVIYCDIPYNQKKKTKEVYYGVTFNANDFYEWAKSINHPVYFSSCYCDDGYFQDVLFVNKQCLMNNKGNSGAKAITEKLYWNGKGTRCKVELFTHSDGYVQGKG